MRTVMRRDASQVAAAESAAGTGGTLTGVAQLAVVVAGLGLMIVVAIDGAAGWRVVRAVLVLAVTAATVMVIRATGRVARGVLAFSFGLVATAAGAGIALPRLASDGRSSSAGAFVEAAASVAVLVAGLLLVLLGGVTLVRSSRGLWKIPVILALVCGTYAGLWSGVQAVVATNAPPGALGSATPADRGLPYSDVTFPAMDGVRLSGWYLPSANGAAVVLAHGSGSTRSAVLDHAAVLARRGYGVLLYDARGHGRSAGQAMDFGWYGDADVQGAVTFLGAQPDVRDGRIAAVGLSMGGEEAIGAAATDPRIRAVVAEGATGRVAADNNWLSDRYGTQGWLQERLDQLTYATADVLTDATSPSSLRAAVTATAPRPVLLIAAGRRPDEVTADRYLQQVSPATVQLWQIPGSDHTGGLSTAPAEWEQRVTTFLAAALATRS